MRRDNRYVAVLILAASFFVVFVVSGHWPRGGVVEEPSERLRAAASAQGPNFPGLPLDLNSATRDELMALPGIGVKTAERIIDQRTASGGFTSISDLRAIEWLGHGRLARLRGLVYVKVPGEDPTDAPGQADTDGSALQLNP